MPYVVAKQEIFCSSHEVRIAEQCSVGSRCGAEPKFQEISLLIGETLLYVDELKSPISMASEESCGKPGDRAQYSIIG